MNDFVMLGVDKTTKAKIVNLAKENGRTIAGQVRWMVNHSDTARAPITDSNSTVCQGAGGVDNGEERKDV